MADVDVKLKSNGNYWQAYWPAPGNPKVRKVKSLGSKKKYSKRQAGALCRQLAADLRSGKADAEQSKVPRLSELLAICERKKSVLRKGTHAIYTITGNYLTRFFDTDPRIDRITHAQAGDWRDALAAGEFNLDNADRCDPPKEVTVCKYVRTAKAVFAVAVQRRDIAVNPFGELKGNAPNPDRNWTDVTAGDMAKILDACPNDGYRCMFALCRWVGLRRDEARLIQWNDILWDKNKIMVNVRVENPTTKWQKRIAPVEPPDHPTGMMRLFRMWFENAKDGSVFPCEGVTTHHLYRDVDKILTAAGVLYDDPFHTLRKCWETELSMRYPLHVVVAWLGNTFEVARKHYLRVPDELYGEVSERKPPMIVVFAEGGYRAQIVPSRATEGQQAGNGATTPSEA